MPHFFIKTDNKFDNKIIISDKENYHHIARVLRARIGESISLIDEYQVEYKTKITDITSSNITCEIISFEKSNRDLEFDLFLAQSPLRSDAQLTVMEKATELGVRGVYPIITDNCSVSIDVAKKKLEKWQKVMYEASKQCERANIPQCFEPAYIDNVLESNIFDKIIVFGERSTELSLKKFLVDNTIHKNEKILIIIGPEGGFSQKEFDFFKNKHFPIVSLGNLILKAETAVIVALGDIIYEYKG